jgi:hypothetical protein
MKTTTKQMLKKVLKISAVVIAVVAVGVIGYRYYNRPVQTWNPDVFEGRNPDKIESKDNGQRYWVGENEGDGFYITDETVSSGDKKVYCVSGGVTSDNASFTLGDSTDSGKNGYFTHCASQTVNDKRQLTFTVTSGQVQIYRVDRKR